MKKQIEKKKVNKKVWSFVIVGVLALALVSAAIAYYAVAYVHVNIEQPISINGKSGGLHQTIRMDISCPIGQTCLGESITISNSADIPKDITLSVVNPFIGNVDLAFVGKMTFTYKDLYTGIASGNTEEIVYSITGDKFVVSGIPDGYTLIYYPDTSVWATNLANIIVLSEGANNIESLPISVDIGDNYCNIEILNGGIKANPNAKVCHGAKLWLVEDGYVTALKSGTWTPSKILFETDLITYTDSTTGKVLVPAKSTITIYLQVTSDVWGTGANGPIHITIA